MESRVATLVQIDAADASLPRVPYSPTLRPYLADPLMSEHWLFNTGDSGCLAGLKGASSLSPKAGASSVRGVTISAGGSGYSTAPTVTFAAPPSGVTATGVATVAGGVVTGIFVTNPGSGYVTPPTVTLGGPGTGASASAVLDGRPTYSSSYLTLPAGGLNGLMSAYDDEAAFTAFFVAKYKSAGAVYMGAGDNQPAGGGDFTFSNSSGFQNNMRGSAGGGSLAVSGTSTLADGTLIFGAISYDGVTRRLMLGSYAKPSSATTKTLTARKFGFGNLYYALGTFDRALELYEAGYRNGYAASAAELDNLYARTKARQSLLGNAVL
jgi:hypothetical protein